MAKINPKLAEVAAAVRAIFNKRIAFQPMGMDFWRYGNPSADISKSWLEFDCWREDRLREARMRGQHVVPRPQTVADVRALIEIAKNPPRPKRVKRRRRTSLKRTKI